MKITINLFATLRNNRFDSAQKDFPSGMTISNVLETLAIPENEAAIIFVNGRHAEPYSELHDGDTLSIFPPIGGG